MNISNEAFGDELTVMVNGQRQRIRVDVIATGPDNTILAVSEKTNGFIELPGGGVNVGESFEDAAIREAMEESGWIVANPKVMTLDCTDIHNAAHDSWLKQKGYDQERNVVVICEAVKFEPNATYRSEGDGKRHELLPIAQVIQETSHSLGNVEMPGVVIASSMRLAAIQKLLKLRLSVESLPLYAKW